MPRLKRSLEPKRPIKERNPIFERKADRGPNAEKVKAWIQWQRRIRKGQLTDEELKDIRTRLSSYHDGLRKAWDEHMESRLAMSFGGYDRNKDLIALHLTDISSLGSILRMGLRTGASEVSVVDFNNIGFLGGVDFSYAPTTYRDVVFENKYVEEYNPVLDRMFFKIFGEDSKDFVLKCFKNLQALLGITTYTHTKPMALEELTVIKKYYQRYKKGDLSFLKKETELAEIKEAFARFLAKRNYFTLNRGYGVEMLHSSMNVGLIYAPNVYFDARTSGQYLSMHAKPMGLLLQNPATLEEVLGIMLSNVKSLESILPIYYSNRETGKTELLWPKKLEK
jgi:hypothetical protein